MTDIPLKDLRQPSLAEQEAVFGPQTKPVAEEPPAQTGGVMAGRTTSAAAGVTSKSLRFTLNKIDLISQEILCGQIIPSQGSDATPELMKREIDNLNAEVAKFCETVTDKDLSQLTRPEMKSLINLLKLAERALVQLQISHEELSKKIIQLEKLWEQPRPTTVRTDKPEEGKADKPEEGKADKPKEGKALGEIRGWARAAMSKNETQEELPPLTQTWNPIKGWQALTDFNAAVGEVRKGNKLVLVHDRKGGGRLEGRERGPFAWMKKFLGKVGRSSSSEDAANVLIEKLYRAYQNGSDLTSAECQKGAESIKDLESSDWFEATLKNASHETQRKFNVAKKWFSESKERREAKVQERQQSIRKKIGEECWGQRWKAEWAEQRVEHAVDQLDKTFDKKISDLDEKIPKVKANIHELENKIKELESKKPIDQAALRKLRDEKNKQTSSLKIFEQSKKDFQDGKPKMIQSLRAKGVDMMHRAEGSEVGGVTEGKSTEKQPFSLRCFQNMTTGEFSFEISLELVASGGEAEIKEIVDLQTGETEVKRKPILAPQEDLARDKLLAERAKSKLQAETALIQDLTSKGVEGILSVEWETYEGKSGEIKRRPVSKKYPGNLSGYEKSTEDDPQKNHTIATQLIRTVVQMHQQGVVHRDLKGGNVVVDEKGTIAVIDFGLAARKGAPVNFSKFPGSPGYIAPEVFDPNTKEASPSHDLWSLGMMLMTIKSKGKTCAQDFKNRLDEIEKLQSAIASPDLKNDIAKKKDLINELNKKTRALMAELKKEDCPIGQPAGEIIAGLLEPDPAQRMDGETLAKRWKEVPP